LNAVSGIEAFHAQFAERTTAPMLADFSPDGKQLLIGTVGANHNSTYPQSDFWTLSPATQKWTFVGPGQKAVFAPEGESVLVVTPRELVKVGKGRDWMAQLLIVDPTTHSQQPIAGGPSNNADPCRCAKLAGPAAVSKAARPASAVHHASVKRKR
jgi:hypothetical protein